MINWIDNKVEEYNIAYLLSCKSMASLLLKLHFLKFYNKFTFYLRLM